MIGDDVGRRLPALSSSLRPRALDELRHWGGEGLIRAKRVLDLGCGDGRFALGFSPLAATIVGVDPDPDSIAAARAGARKARLRNTRFKVGMAQKLPFPDHSFEVVLLSWTL